jgi:hypothetical protein
MTFIPIPTRNKRSELIFSLSRTHINELTLPLLRPVREVVRRYRGVRGRVAAIGNRALQAESYLELMAARVTIVCSGGAYVLEQPFHLVFLKDGEQRVYTPDFLIVGADGPIAVEVKPDKLANSDEDMERFRLIGELLEGHGIRFHLWRKSEIEVRPRWKSVLSLLLYRRLAIEPEDRGKVRKVLRLGKTNADIRTLAATAVVTPEVVLRMILDGDLFVDFNEPLTLNAKVSGTPFQNQLWPVPSATGGLREQAP